MNSTPRVHLAPAHPAMGWVSMNRYWQALRGESEGDSDVASLLEPGLLHAPAASQWMRAWKRRVVYPWLVKTRVRAGVIHVLDHSFAHLLAHVRSPVRTVVTVHDLIPLSYPGRLTPAQHERFRRSVEQVRKADKVVCVSEHTCGETARLLQVPDAKLHVLPNGTSSLPAADEVMSRRLAKLPPYIFSVGGVDGRKNLKLLPPLASCLMDAGQRAVFVRAGALLSPALAADIRKYADLHELGRVSDAELAAGYRHAALTLIPSTHEGFGLPVLESMQAGCPVVYSLATSLPEVAGAAGLGFSPHDAAQAADHCLRLLTDSLLREDRADAGRRHAAAYTWQAHWRGLRQIYDSLLEA